MMFRTLVAFFEILLEYWPKEFDVSTEC